MRTDKEVLGGMTVFYYLKDNGNYRIYMVQDNYSHSVGTIIKSIVYGREALNLSVPDYEEINIEVLKGDRYNRVMSIEFDSKNPPSKQGFELTANSGLWDSLKY